MTAVVAETFYKENNNQLMEILMKKLKRPFSELFKNVWNSCFRIK